MSDQEDLTLPVARQVLFTSFYLSQGLPELQLHLFRYVALRRPAWRLTAQMRHELLSSLFSSIQALIGAGMHPMPKVAPLKRELFEQIRTMQVVLERMYEKEGALDEEDGERQLLAQLAQGFIVADYLYLSRPQGRVRSKKALSGNQDHPHRDPHFSFVCHYILLRKRLGVRVFDELLADLRTVFFQRDCVFEMVMQDKEAREQFPLLLKLYNQTHPALAVEFFTA